MPDQATDLPEVVQLTLSERELAMLSAGYFHTIAELGGSPSAQISTFLALLANLPTKAEHEALIKKLGDGLKALGYKVFDV